ncbi:hypothetical protein SBA2_630047 [Acidobacteriia bacterium SbA2]|nr:hypothetical protein SBA2_630047 [Acidobacteriia bacterium SbA2]
MTNARDAAEAPTVSPSIRFAIGLVLEGRSGAGGAYVRTLFVLMYAPLRTYVGAQTSGS